MSTPADSTPVLKVQGLQLAYAGRPVLAGVDLALARGEVLAVLGRNGVGKTTLLQALFNLGPAWTGSIDVMGQAVRQWPTHRIARLGMALVPQGRGVFAQLSVAESLRLATLAPRGGRSVRWTLEDIYTRFPRLAARRRAASSTLSGGERQLLALARALLTQPDILVLDEPSEGLAPLAVQAVLVDNIRDLAQAGLSVLLAEQNVAAALAVASRTLVLGAGRVVFDGSPAALRAQPALQQEYLGV